MLKMKVAVHDIAKIIKHVLNFFEKMKKYITAYEQFFSLRKLHKLCHGYVSKFSFQNLIQKSGHIQK